MKKEETENTENKTNNEEQTASAKIVELPNVVETTSTSASSAGSITTSEIETPTFVVSLTGALITMTASTAIPDSIYHIKNRKLQIHHLGLMKFITEVLGIRRVKSKSPSHFVQIKNKIISAIDCTEDIIPMVSEYIQKHYPYELGGDFTKRDLLNKLAVGVDIYYSRKKFYFVDEINIAPIKDGRDYMQFYFRNRFVKITAGDITVHEYKDLSHNIWKKQIIDRDVVYPETTGTESVYSKFLFRAMDEDSKRFDSARSFIGYLLHNYKDRSKCPVVVAMDEKIPIEGESNGGTGKGIFSKALDHMMPTLNINARGYTSKNQFSFQELTAQHQLLTFNDAIRNFPFEDLYAIITDVINIQRKHKSTVTLLFEDIAKILLTTNNVLLADEGPSALRRIIHLEFSPYYTLERTPALEFRHCLFDDWNTAKWADEWDRFHSFMFECCQFYLQNSYIEHPPINRGTRKMHVNVSNELIEFLEDTLKLKIQEKKTGRIKPGHAKSGRAKAAKEVVLPGKSFEVTLEKKKLMRDFLREYPLMQKKFRTKQIFSRRVNEYFKSKGIEPQHLPLETKTHLVFELTIPTEPVVVIAAA